MKQQFTIVRDCAKYHYKKGNERLVVTQFDTGICLNFDILNNKESIQLSNCKGFVSFVDETDKLLSTVSCEAIQDTSMSPKTSLYCLVDSTVTLNSGVVRGIIDLIDERGFRTALRPFTITILPHLLKTPISIEETDKEETEEEQPSLPEIPEAPNNPDGDEEVENKTEIENN